MWKAGVQQNRVANSVANSVNNVLEMYCWHRVQRSGGIARGGGFDVLLINSSC